MLLIHKQNLSPQLANNLHQLEASDEWHAIPEDDTSALRAFFDHNLPKQGIRESLLKEQHGLCAYCMSRITDNGLSTTIEHWKPLSTNKHLALKYSNMLGVCQGGKQTYIEERRILCCDACKSEKEIEISPLNEIHMNQIAYMRSGTIYVQSLCEKWMGDINDRLCLNGILDENGNTITDTATQLVKRRKDAHRQYEAIMRMLESKGKVTPKGIQAEIDNLMNAAERMEMVGVIVFFLKRRMKSAQ